jgi:hypothetical protein
MKKHYTELLTAAEIAAICTADDWCISGTAWRDAIHL